MEEADNTFGLNAVEIKGEPLIPVEKKMYKCGKGHMFETNGFDTPLYFTVWQGNKSLGSTNYLCGECVIGWANENFTLNKVESDG